MALKESDPEPTTSVLSHKCRRILRGDPGHGEGAAGQLQSHDNRSLSPPFGFPSDSVCRGADGFGGIGPEMMDRDGVV